MTELVWKKAWELTGQHEGNYQCLYNDRGNWTSGIVGTGKLKGTKYGISAMSYPKLDILNLTEADAEKIFHDDYWVANKCYALPDALSVALFDYVVNSPAKQAIKDLQICLGIKSDGIIGPQTIGVANTKPVKDVLNEFMLRRLEFMVTKCDWRSFGKGWGERIYKTWHECEKLI
jgi:lysozyme family protein